MLEVGRGWLERLRGSRILGRLGLSNTKRAALLAVVVCALALSVAMPLRTYFSQRAEIAEQNHQQELLRDQVGQLQRRSDQLADPEQIKAEARKRLRYVMPGETPYVVQLPDQSQPDQGTSQQAQPPKRKQQEGSWYANLWDSINK